MNIMKYNNFSQNKSITKLQLYQKPNNKLTKTNLMYTQKAVGHLAIIVVFRPDKQGLQL